MNFSTASEIAFNKLKTNSSFCRFMLRQVLSGKMAPPPFDRLLISSREEFSRSSKALQELFAIQMCEKAVSEGTLVRGFKPGEYCSLVANVPLQELN